MNLFPNFYIQKKILPTKFEVGSLETFHKNVLKLKYHCLLLSKAIFFKSVQYSFFFQAIFSFQTVII